MRKSLWIMLAVMVVAVSAPNADADEFQYTYTVTAPLANAFSWETVPIPGVTAEVTLPSSSLASVTIGSNLTVLGCSSIFAVVLDLGGAGNQFTQFNNFCLAGNAGGIGDIFGLPLSDYTKPGDYFFTSSRTDLFVQAAELEVRAVTTPEPSSVALMLLGVGLVLLLRKRIGQRLPQAS